MSNRTSGGILVLAIVAIVSITAGAWAGTLMANSFAVQPDAPAVQETIKADAAKSTRENNAEEPVGPADKPWGPVPPSNDDESPAPESKKNVTDPDHGFTDYKSWLAMMQASAVHWDEPTDGQKHPQISMTSGHETSSPIGQNVRKGEKPVTITLSATVDKEALFEFNKDMISYRPFRSTLPAGASGEGKIYPFEGNYPVNVSVNGIRWRNLRNYFKLDFTPNLKTLGGMEMTQGDVTFLCRYGDSYGNSRLVLEIFNRGEKPVPVQIKLTTTAPEKQETK